MASRNHLPRHAAGSEDNSYHFPVAAVVAELHWWQQWKSDGPPCVEGEEGPILYRPTADIITIPVILGHPIGRLNAAMFVRVAYIREEEGLGPICITCT